MSTDPGRILLAAVITAVVTLPVTESYQSTPWLAEKFMRWSAHLRYTDDPQRATVRQEELTSLLTDLPTLLKLFTATGFLLRALASRAAHPHKHAKREPRTARRSPGARFRITLAALIILYTGTAFWTEYLIVGATSSAPAEGIIFLVTSGPAVGVLPACYATARLSTRLSRYHLRLVEIMSIFFVFATFSVLPNFVGPEPREVSFWTTLLCGAVFIPAATTTGAFMSKFKYSGVVIGTLTNFTSIALAAFLSSSSAWLYLALLSSGLGIAIGAFSGGYSLDYRYENRGT